MRVTIALTEKGKAPFVGLLKREIFNGRGFLWLHTTELQIDVTLQQPHWGLQKDVDYVNWSWTGEE